MKDSEHKRQGPGHEPSAVVTLLTATTIVTSVGSMLLVVGLGSALTNGYKVGAYAAFGGGLAASIIGVIMIHGGMAMLCHRVHIRDNARTRAEIHELNRNMRAIIAILAERSTSDADQVGAARRSHEN